MTSDECCPIQIKKVAAGTYNSRYVDGIQCQFNKQVKKYVILFVSIGVFAQNISSKDRTCLKTTPRKEKEMTVEQENWKRRKISSIAQHPCDREFIYIKYIKLGRKRTNGK